MTMTVWSMRSCTVDDAALLSRYANASGASLVHHYR